MPSRKQALLVEVDPLDFESKTTEEWIQMALDAITQNGFWQNRQPILSLHKAAKTFNISKNTLATRFNGWKTHSEAHKKEQKLSAAWKDVML